MFNQIGPLELVIVLAIVLLIFGPKRLPSLGRQLGRGMREFKDSVTGRHEDDAPDEHATLSSGPDEPVATPAEPVATPAEPAAAKPAEPAAAEPASADRAADTRP